MRSPFAVAALFVVAAALAACGESAPFEPRSFDDVGAALEAGGLQVCGTFDAPGHANQAIAGREYVVARDCAAGADEDAVVVVDEYGDSEHRDAAARAAIAHVRPRMTGAVWTYGPFTISVSGERDPATIDRVITALDELGAK